MAFRLPEPLLDALRDAAEKSNLSIAQEAERRLDQSFKKRGLDPEIERAIERAVRKGMKE